MVGETASVVSEEGLSKKARRGKGRQGEARRERDRTFFDHCQVLDHKAEVRHDRRAAALEVLAVVGIVVVRRAEVRHGCHGGLLLLVQALPRLLQTRHSTVLQAHNNLAVSGLCAEE